MPDCHVASSSPAAAAKAGPVAFSRSKPPSSRSAKKATRTATGGWAGSSSSRARGSPPEHAAFRGGRPRSSASRTTDGHGWTRIALGLPIPFAPSPPKWLGCDLPTRQSEIFFRVFFSPSASSFPNGRLKPFPRLSGSAPRTRPRPSRSPAPGRSGRRGPHRRGCAPGGRPAGCRRRRRAPPRRFSCP